MNLRHMVVAYDTLKTNNDTLNAGLAKGKNKNCSAAYQLMHQMFSL